MWIFLFILVLAAVLAAMLWYYNQQESDWQNELRSIKQHRPAHAPVAENTHIIPPVETPSDSVAAKTTLPEPTPPASHKTIIIETDDNPQAATPKTPENPFQIIESIKHNAPVLNSIKETDPFFSAEPLATPSTTADDLLPPEQLKSFTFDLIDDEPPAIITLEEATRNLRRHLEPEQEPIETEEENIDNHDDAEQKTPTISTPAAPKTSIITPPSHLHTPIHQQDDAPPAYSQPDPDLEIITLEDAMRAWQDDEPLIATQSEPTPPIEDLPSLTYDDVLSATAVRERTLQHVPRPSPKPLPADAETISEDEIRESLLRQRLARRQQLLAEAPVHSIWRPTIPEDEVFANLARTNAPAARRRRNTSIRAEQLSPAPTHEPISQPRHVVASTPYPRMRHRKTTHQPNHQAESTPNRPQPNTQAEMAALTRFTQTPAPAMTETPPLVSITEPVIVPPSPIEAPEILEQETFTAAPTIILPEHPVQVRASFRQPETHRPSDAYYPAYKAYQEELQAESATEYVDTPPTYPLPTTALLLPPQHNSEAVQTEEQLLENGITIEEKLAEFRVKVKVIDAYAGPVITRYEIEPDTGVRGNSVLNLEKDLARSLGMASIRVVETIPGKNCMGIELPNPKRQMIRISEIFHSSAFTESRSKLTLALGQDITGQPVVTDLAKAPHLLVAGTTGSGKSVGVNSMILSLLFKATPEDVRLILIDPKMLELSVYEGIPHLLAPVITDMKYTANALHWCVNEMEKRYRLMSHLGVRNLSSYNAKILEGIAQGQTYTNPFSQDSENPEVLEKLPSIVVVVDEFADLMMVAGKKIEELIARLAQKARAAGIHLILATQRPSVDVITGLIKANIPTRIAFQVSSKVDSRTILDQMGAENLLGQGDMLFLPPGTGYPQRVHGAFVADSEVHEIVEYLKQFGEPNYVEEILSGSPNDDVLGRLNLSDRNSERDPLFDEAVATVLRTQKPTISSLQRFLRIGYNKAATLFDQMEAEGIVSAADSAGKRTILARVEPTDSSESS